MTARLPDVEPVSAAAPAWLAEAWRPLFDDHPDPQAMLDEQHRLVALNPAARRRWPQTEAGPGSVAWRDLEVALAATAAAADAAGAGLAEPPGAQGRWRARRLGLPGLPGGALLSWATETSPAAAPAAEPLAWHWCLRTMRTTYTPALSRLLELPAEAPAGLGLERWFRRVHPDDFGPVMGALRPALTGSAEPVTIDCRLQHPGGRWRWVRVATRRQRGEDGHEELVGDHEDITDRRAAQALGAQAQRRLQTLLDGSPVGLGRVDVAQGLLLQANAALVRWLGLPEDGSFDPLPVAQLGLRAEQLERAWQSGGAEPARGTLACPDGPRAIHWTLSPDPDEESPRRAWIVVQDASEHEAVRQQLQQACTHDGLTGVVGRHECARRLSAWSDAMALDAPRGVALLTFGLDHFARVNDALGAAAGDEVLRAVAARLAQAVAEVHRGGLVARLGGDEFALLAPGLTDPAALRAEAQRLLGVLEAPVAVGTRVVRPGASIGVAVGLGRIGGEELMRDADIALHEAKAAGRGRVVLFDEGMRARLERRVQIEESLHTAVARGQVYAVYQPIVDLETGRMTSVEALLRWDHPALGPVSPAEFIPIAEAGPRILALGRWILFEACRQWARWQAEAPDLAPRTMSVNLSRAQLAQGEPLLALVRGALEQARMPAQALQLEITEREVVGEEGDTVDQLRRLRALGVRLAMDDFGTGASSLGCLREFPFDVIKIDRSFVTNLTRDPDVLAVAHATVNVIENLGMVSVAEGIEDAGELAVLQALGCRYGQGWLFGRPMRADRLLASLQAPATA